MKKSKLSIQKFKIAELKHASQIIGGTGVDEGGETTGETHTNDRKNKKKCIFGSAVEVPDISIVSD